MSDDKKQDRKVDPSEKPKPGQLPTKPPRDNDGTTAPDFQDGMKEDGSPNQ